MPFAAHCRLCGPASLLLPLTPAASYLLLPGRSYVLYGAAAAGLGVVVYFRLKVSSYRRAGWWWPNLLPNAWNGRQMWGPGSIALRARCPCLRSGQLC